MRTEQVAYPNSESKSQLQHAHRRQRVVSVVEDRELPLSLSELAAAVAEQSPERDAPTDSLRIRLHHVRLPKLQEQGVLEYDPAQNVVSAYVERQET